MPIITFIQLTQVSNNSQRREKCWYNWLSVSGQWTDRKKADRTMKARQTIDFFSFYIPVSLVNEQLLFSFTKYLWFSKSKNNLLKYFLSRCLYFAEPHKQKITQWISYNFKHSQESASKNKHRNILGRLHILAFQHRHLSVDKKHFHLT